MKCSTDSRLSLWWSFSSIISAVPTHPLKQHQFLSIDDKFDWRRDFGNICFPNQNVTEKSAFQFICRETNKLILTESARKNLKRWRMACFLTEDVWKEKSFLGKKNTVNVQYRWLLLLHFSIVRSLKKLHSHKEAQEIVSLFMSKKL